MVVKVKAPGTCGELVQGVINGQYFLITCPVDIYSEATITPDSTSMPCSHPKARIAVERTLYYLGLGWKDCQVQVASRLPVGKGMASSSADISAACQAAAIYVGRKLSPDEIADIALTIEPTDAIFYPGIMMFDHVEGKLRRSLGTPPSMDIAIFDVGGEVDTLSFNQRNDLIRLNRAKEQQVREAAQLVIDGIEQGDCRLVAQGATISALANQAILYKPCLQTMIQVGSFHGAIGVNAAHSGTVLGVMFPVGEGNRKACIADILQRCGSSVRFMHEARLISGGLLIEEGDE